MNGEKAEAFGPPRWLLISIAIATAVVIVAAVTVAVRFNDAANVAGDNREILTGLQRAEQQRSAESKKNAIAFAIVLEDLAGAFATPPAPDPSRLRAVAGLCDTAKTFRLTAGDIHPPPCPAT